MPVGFCDRAPLEDLAEDGLKRPGASAGVFCVGRIPARKFLTESVMAFVHAMGGVFGLILMGMVGYVLAGKGWFGPETRILLPRLITYVALPPYLMSTIMRAFRRDGLLDFIQGALLPLAAVALTFVLAIIIGRIARVQRQHFGLFCASVANSNTIFVGIPVNLALFGEEAVPYVLLYYFASTVFFWTVGQYAITRDIEGEARLIPLRTRVMQIFSPPLLGFLTGLLLILCNVELPFFIQDAARYLGNMTTPLALIFIGITMHDMGLRGITITRDLALALSGRILLGPLVMFTLLTFFPVGGLMGKVFIMQSSLPVMAQTAILSAYYHTDAEFGAKAVTMSTLLCIFTVPLYMTLL